MARKLSGNQIARDLGEELRQRLVRGTIRDLQGLRGESMLSGEFSGLRNVWEEICVQQQREESCFWDAYLEVIDAFIEGRLEGLKPYELEALWLLTYEADDWQFEDEGQRNPYPVYSGDVLTYLQRQVLSEACDWSNPRITRYLERDSEWY